MQLKKSFLLALIIGIFSVALWEYYWRSQGLKPNLDDNKDLWALQRAKLNNSHSDLAVFIGSSRILYDIQLDIWEEMTALKPVMLAVQGASPIPIFKDIVENTDFSGNLLVGITPGLFFSTTYPQASPIRRAQSKVDYYEDRTLAQRINHKISVPLQTNLAFIRDGDEAWDSDVDLNTLLSHIHIGDRGEKPSPAFNNFEEVSYNRHMKMPEFVTNDTAYANTVKMVWKDILTSDLPPPDKESTTKAFVDLANQFKARGGNLILLRCPSSGFFREAEVRGLPRSEFWDYLVDTLQVKAYHFEDYPQFKDLFLPEWSHLSAKDAQFYTHEIIGILKEDKALKGL